LRPVSTMSDDQVAADHIRNARVHGHDMLSSSPVTSRESSVGGRSELDSCSGRSEDSDKEDDEKQLKVPEIKIPTVRSRAEKLFLVRDAPRSLIIHLKRFTQFGYRGGLRKISGHVAFPLELDLSPFVESARQRTTSDASAIRSAGNTVCSSPCTLRREGSNRLKMKAGVGGKTVRAEHTYFLTGVVVHGGSLHGGHYTAYVREGVGRDFRGGWFYCSDSRVTRASEKEVLDSEAFLLFYERQA
jgi:ubiquitin C-terminal hydrolase